MQTNRRRARLSNSHRPILIGAMPAIVLLVGARLDASTMVWTGSTASITHDPGTPGGAIFTAPNFAIPAGAPALAAPFAPHIDNFTVSGHTVNTNASAGISHSESASSAVISIASGTGVSQTDPNHVQNASATRITLLNEWAVSNGTFGPPISGSFSLPYGAKIGANGSASISILINWDVIHAGNVEVALKNYTNSATYNGGASGKTILTSFTAPTTLFSPSTFTDGDTFVIQGEIDFTANNDDGPTISELPTAADFGLGAKSAFLLLAVIGGQVGANLIWTGAQSNSWDTTSVPNFAGSGSSSISFNDGDNVTFNDTGSAASSKVAIGSVVSPGSILVNNSQINYTFGGTGSIAGGALLTKAGTASLTLSTSNSYVGGTTLVAGTLNINNPMALGMVDTGSDVEPGSSTSNVRPFNIAGGTIDNSSPTAITLLSNTPMIWSGDFTFAGTSPLNLGIGPVTVVGNNRTLTINGTGGLTVGGTIGGSGGITKAGPGTLTWAGPITLAGLTKVTAGTLVLAPTGAGIISENLSGGLAISAGATVSLIPPVTHSNRMLLTLGGLSFTGTSGFLDLSGNDMRLQGGSLSSAIAEIAQAYNGGAWNGTGGITSSTAATDSTHLTTLGVIINTTNGNTQLYGSSGPLGLFDGSNPAPADILVKYTYYGDANLDGKIDGSDYSRIDAGFLAHFSTWYNGDFNYDGVVNGSDYTLIDNAFNNQGASLAGLIADPTVSISSQIAGALSVPEPSTLGLAAIASAGLLKRRRCRSTVKSFAGEQEMR